MGAGGRYVICKCLHVCPFLFSRIGVGGSMRGSIGTPVHYGYRSCLSVCASLC